MEEIVRIFGELIEEGEAIRDQRYENSGDGWHRSKRWESHSKEILTKHISMVEAEKFDQVTGPMRFLPPQFSRPGVQDPNFVNHVNAKLQFLRALQENIDKHPEAWREKLGKTKGEVQKMDINELNEKRFQYLYKLYELAGGDRYKDFNPFVIGQELGFDEDLTNKIEDYLVAANLIERVGHHQIAITHDGILEIEEALSRPEEPTEHFPPANITIGQMIGSQIQVASPGATQVITISKDRYPTVREIIQELKDHIDEFGLKDQKKADLQADIQTIEAQMSRSEPKPAIITESLFSIENILKVAEKSTIVLDLLKTISGLLGGGG